MRIISIANQKGGCGKTTTSINLAAALSQNGKRTLLIDLDPQAHASLGLNVESHDSIYNVISRLTPRKMEITDIIKRADKSFDIVPSNMLVGTLEQELADEIGRETKLCEILDQIKDVYDYILIDCPPSLGFLTINALRASHEVCIPVETSRFSMQGVAHLMDIVNLIKDRLNHHVDCKILITMFDSRLRHSFSMLSKIRDEFSSILFDTIIHINVKLKESAVMGKTVVNYDKYCRGAKDYFSMAKEIIAQEAPVQAPAPELRPISQKMQDLIQEEIQKSKIMNFYLKDPDARSVYVTGSFNDWSLDEKCRMLKEADGWSIDIPLEPGTYKYQFIVDGRWREDPDNSRQERNSFGDINSLLEVTTDA
ncbi:MAG: AAA family ATPase [Candidatus Omnitrophica bacterium]|nr:AAA family ATPase [Candidatus Omnitrophota bacterium]